ncbi:envelope stress response protein PspG [Aeromonas molluscorum]|jgi:phage shock protein G|uniref:Phage shock protein G n=1 Tax=Aeromonas molluscorum 848 TaxID=1268236 RepID=R1F909_9GAMM|nr:envelope stress response protein PspG [Aeromonas molluscorum]EOD56243.1 phage shock protein G [Aeromonas molluscorum 848]
MLEFLVLLAVLIVMAMAGFTVLAMVVVSGVFMLFGALAGMIGLVFKLAPWILLGLVVYWLLGNRRRTGRPNSYR